MSVKRDTTIDISEDGLIATIPLTQGFYTKVLVRDLAKVFEHTWFAHRHPSGNYYAMRGQRMDSKQTMVYMHRVLTGVTDPKTDVDHEDQDTLNNCDDNLRVATRSQNNCNCKMRSTNTSGYRGVQLYKATGKYQAYIRVNKRSKHLGFFATAVEAAYVRDREALRHYGEFAMLNFPELRETYVKLICDSTEK